MSVGMVNTFLGTMISVTVETDSKMLIFQGLLLEADENFIYLDRNGSGEVDTALGVTKILAIEFLEDTPDKVDLEGEKKASEYSKKLDDFNKKIKDFHDKVEDAKKLIGFDDDDEGKGTIQ